jgi:glucokinase
MRQEYKVAEHIAVGVDIGGTKVAYTAADRDGTVLAEYTDRINPREAALTTIGSIAESVNRIVKEAGQPVAGIGIACPGPVDAAAGVALNAVNLGWKDVPLREALRARLKFDAPIWLQNDVKAGALGEMVFGAAKGQTDFVYLAIGTGLGGGAVVNGQIINGVNGWAMEVGHMSLNPKGRPCTCGNIGCAEMYVSGKGLLAGAGEHILSNPEYRDITITTHRVLDLARRGEPLARKVLDEAADALGIVMAWCTAVFNPAMIVIGGGLGIAAFDLLSSGAMLALRARVLPEIHANLRVVQSGALSSALGPAALVWYGLNAAPRADA